MHIAIINSCWLAAGSALLALPCGTLLALLLARYEVVGRRAAVACLGLLLLLPLYVQLAGWDACFGKVGWFSLAFGSLATPWLDGMRGAVFVHGLAAIPWVALLVGIGLMQVDPAQEEAALLVAPPSVVLCRVTLPHAWPFVVAAAIAVVVSTTAEMTVTNIYLMNPGQRTMTEQFYMTFALSADAGEATMAVLPGIIGLTAVVALALWSVTRLTQTNRLRISHSRVWAHASGTRWLCTCLVWCLLAILLAIPIASLSSKAGFQVVNTEAGRMRSWSAAKCLAEVWQAPVRFHGEFTWTLLVATAAATLATAVGTALGWFARGGGWRRWPAIGSIALGVAIPGPLVGVLLIVLFNHDLPPRLPIFGSDPKSWLLMLYDQTPLAPILAQAIRALPWTTLIAWYSFRSISPSVLEAAVLDGSSPWQVFSRIAVPLRRGPLFAAWLIAFAVAAGDLAWAHLVTPPGMDLIQRRVFGLLHSGVEEQVAAIALVNAIAYLLLSVASLWLLSRVDPAPGRRTAAQQK